MGGRSKDSRFQPQADAALLHYVESKNPRGVALMIPERVAVGLEGAL
jgi:preprotein translocase subunit Sec61beta